MLESDGVKMEERNIIFESKDYSQNLMQKTRIRSSGRAWQALIQKLTYLLSSPSTGKEREESRREEWREERRGEQTYPVSWMNFVREKKTNNHLI